jgi:hypothetical protein
MKQETLRWVKYEAQKKWNCLLPASSISTSSIFNRAQIFIFLALDAFTGGLVHFFLLQGTKHSPPGKV